MSSRAAPSVRRVTPDFIARRTGPTVPRDLSDGVVGGGWFRKVVCKRCGLVIIDHEPHGSGDFPHYAKPHQTRAAACSNEGMTLTQDSPEVTPFRRKSQRRKLKRKGIRP